MAACYSFEALWCSLPEVASGDTNVRGTEFGLPGLQPLCAVLPVAHLESFMSNSFQQPCPPRGSDTSGPGRYGHDRPQERSLAKGPKWKNHHLGSSCAQITYSAALGCPHGHTYC